MALRIPRPSMRLKAGLVAMLAATTLAFGASRAAADDIIGYISTNANNVCTYGYNQYNQYTIRCLTINYGHGYQDPEYWWHGTVQILWSYYDIYLNSSTCTIRDAYIQNCWQYRST